MPLRVVIKYNVEFAGTLSEGWSPYPKMNIINIDNRMVSENSIYPAEEAQSW